MAKVRESPKEENSSLRRSIRNRTPLNPTHVNRLGLLQSYFTIGKNKDRSKQTAKTAKMKNNSGYERLRKTSLNSALKENVVASPPKMLQIQPKQLRMSMTPNQPNQSKPMPKRNPIEQQASKTAPTAPTASTAPTAPSTQTTNSSDTQQIVLKRTSPSDVTWASEDICSINLTSLSRSSSLFIFRGDSKSIFWQLPIAFCIIILHGKFKCDLIDDHLRIGDEIKVPAGKGIKITHLEEKTKDGRILCVHQ